MNKNYMTINGMKVELTGDEKNVLEVCRKIGIEIPTFCYHSELSVYGACRMCLVEDDKGNLLASCSTKPVSGLNIRTHTTRVMNARKMILELLLANYHQDCTSCVKSGQCKLQKLANDLGIDDVRFNPRKEREPIDYSSQVLVRDPNKCILCGDCVRMCAEVQGIGVFDFVNRGPKISVTTAFNLPIADVDCINCGQCVAVCPTAALTVRDETSEVWEALNNPKKTVIAQIAPAVRVSLNEEFNLPNGKNYLYQAVAAARLLGFDYIFDTCYGADMTIIEETHEFVGRLAENKNLPQFTSCCPGWVTYVERNEPDLIKNLSTCRSPQAMFGSIAKKYYSQQLNIAPEDLYVVAIMPCTAKKFEAGRKELTTEGAKDTDTVLTVVEFARMIRRMGINFGELEPSSLDMPFGFSSGAGTIFGSSGGVAEASLRYASELVTKKQLKDVNFKEVRGLQGLKEANVAIGDKIVRVAVVSGMKNVSNLLKRIKAGEVEYDLVEVMACLGGCIGGGGQPVPNDMEQRQKRAKDIYMIDAQSPVKKSQNNPTIMKMYDDWLGQPNSKIAHYALHTHYGHSKRIKGMDITDAKPDDEKLVVSVCIGTNCYLKGSYDILQELISLSKKYNLEDKIEFKGTFCLENCGNGPSVKLSVSDYKFGVQKDEVEDFFQKYILVHFSR